MAIPRIFKEGFRPNSFAPPLARHKIFKHTAEQTFAKTFHHQSFKIHIFQLSAVASLHTQSCTTSAVHSRSSRYYPHSISKADSFISGLLTPFFSLRSSHSALLTPLFSFRSSHSAPLTPVLTPIILQSSHFTPILSLRSSHSGPHSNHTSILTPQPSHSGHLTPVFSLRSSHSGLLTPVFSLRSSHSGLLTPVFSLRSSHSGFLTPIIRQSSHHNHLTINNSQ
jgi:hypothetical protein